MSEKYQIRRIVVSLSQFYQTNKKSNNKNSINKDSSLSEHSMSQNPFKMTQKKETPLYALLKGSITIEASLIMPLIAAFMVFMIFFIRVIQVEADVQKSIDMASRKAAVCWSDNVSEATLAVYCDSLIKKRGTHTEFIRGGILGINYLNSSLEGNYVDLVVTYTMPLPVRFFGYHDVEIVQRSRNRKWVGFDPNEEADTINGYVYVTETGEVYHLSRDCVYLNPSIRTISKEDIDGARNKEGSKYYKCNSCKSKNDTGVVFITDYGNSYHSTTSCSGLKRTILIMKLEEAKIHYRPCSKCGEK